MKSKHLLAVVVSASIAVAAGGALQLVSAPATAQEDTEGDGADGDDRQQPSVDEVPAPDDVVVIYRGVLQNEQGEPVSGVFPLNFQLYRGNMSADSIWSERHFVSVVDGRYQVRLGTRAPLARHLLEGDRWLGVELDGEHELLRDRLLVQRPGDGEGAEEVDEDSRVSYADVAERAAEAERARVAETAMSLDGLTADDLEEQSELAIQRLGEHVADPDAHQAAGGPTVGDTVTSAGEEVGGSGGSSYEMNCPDGYVVTGIRGGAGRVVDSITLLCSPLE